MSDQGYNGWANYETWAVGMFLDGNYTGEGTYRQVLDMAHNVLAENDAPEDALYSLEISLKEYVAEETMDDVVSGASLASDLLGAALSEVDWRELATHKLSEIEES